MMTGNKPLPMTVLAGFLGSGKTTLVNHLLRYADGRKVMVLVNDFGELPIDQDLIAAQDGDVLTLANGCACCSMGGDLYKAFDAVLNFSPAPDHLLIEASGVAEPKRIANFAKAEPDLSLNGIVTIVDAVNFEAAHTNVHLSDTIEAQISAAHMLLLNKCDLVSDQDVEKSATTLKKLNDRAPILNIKYGALSPEIFFGLDPEASSYEELMEDPHFHNHEEDFSRWSFQTDTVIDQSELRKILSALPSSVLRFKGIFKVSDQTQLWTAHKVGSHVEITPLPPGKPFSGKTGFVAIGTRNSNLADNLAAAFRSLY